MFKLEAAIAAWRKEMRAGGIKSPAALEELEAHLREEIERHVSAERGEEAAFAAAVRSIGPAHALGEEFAKVEGAREARQWQLFENLFLGAVVGMPLMVGCMALVIRNGTFADMTAGQKGFSLAAAAAFSLLAMGMRWSCGRFPVVRTNRIRDAVLVPVLAWVLAMAFIYLPRCELTVAQSGVVALWTFAPFGIVIGWLWGNATAERHKLDEDASYRISQR
jgi:hypothetical protein